MDQFKLTVTPLENFHFREIMMTPETGAMNTFEGIVRNHNDGRKVTALEYEAYDELCEREADRIIAKAKETFDVISINCVHRVGRLEVGEMAVWIGVTAAHRDHAFQACRYVIDEIKSHLPIWKKEYYETGDSGWVNCSGCQPKTDEPVVNIS